MDIYEKIDEIGEYIDQAKVLPIIREKLLDTDYLMRALGEVYASIPAEIKEAKAIIAKNKERELEIERQAEELIQRTKDECERLISLAKSEARKLTDEHEIKTCAEQEAKAIQEEVLETVERLREQAIQEVEQVKEETFRKAQALETQALDEAKFLKDGADEYANEVLSRLEDAINQMNTIAKAARKHLNEHRGLASYSTGS